MNTQEMSNDGEDKPLPDEMASFHDALSKMQKAPEELRQYRRGETGRRAVWTAVAGAIAFACSSALFVLLKENDRQTIRDLNGQIITLTKRVEGVKTKEEEEQIRKNNDAHKKMFERLDQMRRQDNALRGFFRRHDREMQMLQEEEAALAARKMPLADDEPPPIK